MGSSGVIAEIWSDENSSTCEPHGAEHEYHTCEHYISLPAPNDLQPDGSGVIDGRELPGWWRSFSIPYQPDMYGHVRASHLSLCVVDDLGHTAFQTVLPVEE